jgi:hypothetical protein
MAVEGWIYISGRLISHCISFEVLVIFQVFNNIIDICPDKILADAPGHQFADFFVQLIP